MAKVLTDINLIDKFLERGVDSVYPTKDLLKKKLLSGDRIRVYQGFDPTGPYLHVGHAMGIRALRILQMLGHEVIFLVGDYTAIVGDPDKDKARNILSAETIENNMKGWKEQANQLIEFEGENPVQFKHNYEWLSKLTLNDLIQLMSHATVQQMLERDLFQRRLKAENPVGLHEFIYPLMQGYDSVAMGVDLEIGGTDQIFNMLMGRALVKDYLGKEKFVRANELMDAPDAKTMSKTKGNGINLSDTPEDMYGKAMSYSDDLITKGLRLLTDVPMEEINQIDQAIKAGENPMNFKKLMAYEIVKTIKGKDAAEKGQKYFEQTVQNREVPAERTKFALSEPTATAAQTAGSLNMALNAGLSNSEIKRIIEQGGFEINGIKITDLNDKTPKKSGDVVKLGKRLFGEIK